MSVRDPDEAAAALAGGANVIDVKEPTRGPLGPADHETIAAIVDRVAARAPVTVALGELLDHEPAAPHPGVAAVKVGLSGCAGGDWRRRLDRLRGAIAPEVVLAPAAYVDHRRADAPPPEDVVGVAAGLGGWLVLDTWDKAGPSSIESLGVARLEALLRLAEGEGVGVVLAGRLTAQRVAEAAGLRPRLVGVRGAACVGGRRGRVEEGLVRAIAQRLAACRTEHCPPPC